MTYFFKRAEIFLAIGCVVFLGVCWMNNPELIMIFIVFVALLALLNFLFFKQIVQRSKYKFTFIPQRVFTLYGFSSTAITLCLIGVIFRQMYLDGANLLLLFGMGMLSISIIIHTLIYSIGKKSNAVKVVKRLFLYFMVAAFFYFVPNSLFVYLNLRKYPDYAKIIEQYLDNPDDIELRLQVNEARKELVKKDSIPQQ